MESVGKPACASLHAMSNRILQNVKQMGRLNAGLYLLGRVLRAVSRERWELYKYQFLAQAVVAEPLCRGRGKNIAVRQCFQAADLPPAYPRPGAVLDARYGQGALSLAAIKDGELSGFLWLSPDGYQEDEVRARYRLASPQSCWDFDVWVRPEDRLGLTFARLWEEANLLLRARAVRWSCSRISAFNAASLGAHGAIGTIGLGSALFLRCGRWQWMLASLAPYIHLSRHPASFPLLSFDTGALPQHPSMEPSCRTLKPSKPSSRVPSG